MQDLPKTFCPAKWDELFINLEFNLAYACCKSTPIQIDTNISNSLRTQKKNLMAGIKDPSCNYCWKSEDAGLPSIRMLYLSKFKNNIEDYTDDRMPSSVEINLGNECNFQCMYCNPKFSSKWYADVSKKPYSLFNSKFNYALPIKKEISKDDKFSLIKKYSLHTHRIDLIGGEPFYTKRFFELLEIIQSKEIFVTTNLSCSKAQIDKFFKLTEKFEKVGFHFSLDATGKIAEFTRHGLDFDLFDSNLRYILKNAPKNFNFQIKSLMTSITITDLENLKNYLHEFLNGNFKWLLYNCITPEFQSFLTLKDELRGPAIDILSELEKTPNVLHADTIKSAILTSSFNKTLYNQLKVFVNEFSTRKNILVPVDL